MSEHRIREDTPIHPVGTILLVNDLTPENVIVGVKDINGPTTTLEVFETTSQTSPINSRDYLTGRPQDRTVSFELNFNALDSTHRFLQQLSIGGGVGTTPRTWYKLEPISRRPQGPFDVDYSDEYLAGFSARTFAQYNADTSTDTDRATATDVIDMAAYNATIAKIRAGTAWAQNSTDTNDAGDAVNDDDVTQAEFALIFEYNRLISEALFDTVLAILQQSPSPGFVQDSSRTVKRWSWDIEGHEEDARINADGVTEFEFFVIQDLYVAKTVQRFDCYTFKGYLTQFDPSNPVDGAAIMRTCNIQVTGPVGLEPDANQANTKTRAVIDAYNALLSARDEDHPDNP